MRFLLAGLAAVTLAGTLAAEPPAKRFGVEADLKTFPQGTPQEALASVLKAVEQKRADYILAHLADPQFVDDRVKLTGHDELLADTTAKLIGDPGAAKQLQRFLKEGEWTTEDATATVTHKEMGDKVVSFRKIDGRWFLQQPNRKAEKKGARE